MAPIRFSDINFEKGDDVPPEEKPQLAGFPSMMGDEVDGYPKWIAYGQSKTANMLFSLSLAEKLREKGVASFSLHPGCESFCFGSSASYLRRCFS
jgi:NAD(P)-dependent dehydrogenase (short-subunit alcohol dehydrogenase family)